jgi:hypothetical protein
MVYRECSQLHVNKGSLVTWGTEFFEDLFSMMLETEEQTWLGQGRENLGLAML